MIVLDKPVQSVGLFNLLACLMIDVLRDLGSQIREEAQEFGKNMSRCLFHRSDRYSFFLGMLVFFFVSYAYVIKTVW